MIPVHTLSVRFLWVAAGCLVAPLACFVASGDTASDTFAVLKDLDSRVEERIAACHWLTGKEAMKKGVNPNDSFAALLHSLQFDPSIEVRRAAAEGLYAPWFREKPEITPVAISLLETDEGLWWQASVLLESCSEHDAAAALIALRSAIHRCQNDDTEKRLIDAAREICERYPTALTQVR